MYSAMLHQNETIWSSDQVHFLPDKVQIVHECRIEMLNDKLSNSKTRSDQQPKQPKVESKPQPNIAHDDPTKRNPT